MKYIFLFLLLVSCATPDPTHNDFRQELAEQNYILHQKLTHENTDFTTLNKEKYLETMSAQDSSLVKQIQSFDEFQFGVSPHTFVVCVKSLKTPISICDVSSTRHVDRVKMSSNVDLHALMEEIRGP